MKKSEFIKQFNMAILGGFSYITALAWNEAFVNFFKNNPYLSNKGPWIYAIIVTFMSIIFAYFLSNLEENAKKNL